MALRWLCGRRRRGILGASFGLGRAGDAGGLLDQIDDVARGVGPREGARGGGDALDFLRTIEERENFAAEALAGQFGFGNDAARAPLGHFLGVAELVAVGGAAEGNENSG